MKNFIKKTSLLAFFAFAFMFQGVFAEAPVASPSFPVDASIVTPPPTSPSLPVVVTPPPASPSFPVDASIVTPPPTSPSFPDEEVVEDEEETVNEPTTKSSRRGGGSRRNNDNQNSGEVLGATTDASCKMITTFMKQGLVNDVVEVKMLQAFLNTMGANLPVTGFFGPLTHQAVKNFQLQYREQILTPWVTLGLHSSSDIATGYVYKTTQYAINKMLCPDAEITYPTLETI